MAKTEKTQPGRNGGTLNVGGNHGEGRKPKIPNLSDIMIKVMGDEKDEKTAMEAVFMSLRLRAIKGDVSAARLLIEYAYGKPNQNISVTGEDGGPIKVVSTGLNSDERKLLDKLLPGLNVGDNE